MHGYGPVAKTLLQANLLDELHLCVHPHLAGVGDAGDLLIHPGLTKKLDLTSTRTLGSGVIVLTFRNPGRVNPIDRRRSRAEPNPEGVPQNV